ncbi:MAG: sortase [Chloroflexota bacterium]|nr:sortase [Chloroflexota bacterium]
MSDRRTVNDLSLTELEQLLITRKREARMRRLHARGIDRDLPEPPSVKVSPERLAELPELPRRALRSTTSPKPAPSWRARLLTLVELIALVGFVGAVVLWWRETQATNLDPVTPIIIDAAQEQDAASAMPELLPGNPTPPADAGAIPPQYQAWIQPAESVNSVPTTDLSEQRPTRIVIPDIGVDAPVVFGVDWEALKQGVGHYPGSSNPGQRGNLVLSAHNDIFGEIFRHLEDLEPGDRFTIYDAANTGFEYVVRTRRIVEPTEVSVLAQSPEPIATLITCHPYLIDSERLVIQAELIR